MSVIVRSACSADRIQVWTLLLQFAKSYVPEEEIFNGTLDRLLVEPTARFLVVEQESHVVGYALAFVIPTLFANGPILEILEVIIDESRRNTGLGKVLLSELLELAWQCGCVEAVVPTRRASEFYEKLGFVRTAEYLKLTKPN